MGEGKYCSVACASADRRKGEWISCHQCGKQAYKQAHDIERYRYALFCSKSCSIKWQNTLFVGEKHPNWKNGRSSYREILKKDIVAKQCALCEFADQRLLVVHHIDGNRSNNRVSNLTWLCANCHFLVHHYPEESRKLGQLLKSAIAV